MIVGYILLCIAFGLGATGDGRRRSEVSESQVVGRDGADKRLGSDLSTIDGLEVLAYLIH